MNHDQAVILVADDNPSNLQVLFELFDTTTFTVSYATDGEQCLELAHNEHPDLILLDIMMPEPDGFEVCRRLKADEHTQAIPIIFMTALDDTSNKLKGFEVGAVDYITKPIQPDEVLARVNAHLTIRKQQQQLQRQNALIQEQNTQLQELNASKDRFFSILSHDLRSPFTGLLGLTQVLAEEVDSYKKEQIKTFATKMRDSAEDFYELLNNLLTWSRIQRGMIEFHPQTLPLKDAVNRIVALFLPNADQKQITLEQLISEGMEVQADLNMLNAVLRNLISNALKFTHPGGTITLSARPKGGCVEMSVADTGIGIAAEHLPKLFRIDTSYKRRGTEQESGTGLGLIFCKEFIERHGGKISVDSQVGKGTTFTFTLPKDRWSDGARE